MEGSRFSVEAGRSSGMISMVMANPGRWPWSSPCRTPGGVVTRIPGGAIDGTVAVEVHLPGTHPAQAGAEADGTIEIERLTNVPQVGRQVMGQPGSEGALYKLEPDGKQAVRVKVRFGKSSVNAIEIRSGLQPGDKVILSDTTAFHSLDRGKLK